MNAVSQNISNTSINSHIHTRVNRNRNICSVLKLIEKSKIFFENGYWVEAKNVIKKDPKAFIRLLNKSTSYHHKKRIHTFTHVLYIPSLGYSLINFLNEKMASQFLYQANGLIWIETHTEDDEESEEIEEMEEIGENGEIDENEENERTEKTEDTEGGEEIEESEENDDDKIVDILKLEYLEEDGDDEKKENDVDEEDGMTQEKKCVINKKDINIEKFLDIISQKLKKVDLNERQYYIFLFHDIENAENYFSQITFIYA